MKQPEKVHQILCTTTCFITTKSNFFFFSIKNFFPGNGGREAEGSQAGGPGAGPSGLGAGFFF